MSGPSTTPGSTTTTPNVGAAEEDTVVVEMIMQWLMQQRMTQPTDEAELHKRVNAFMDGLSSIQTQQSTQNPFALLDCAAPAPALRTQ
jgi:hypothetical protein